MIKNVALSAVMTASLLLCGQASAITCKGMTEESCTNSNNSCYWVNGYQRSDGVQVKAHCRTKSVKKSLGDSASTTDKSKAKADKPVSDAAKKNTPATKKAS